MNIGEFVQSAAKRFARRTAIRLAVGGAAVAAGGVRAFVGAEDASAAAPAVSAEAARPPAAPAPRVATAALAEAAPATGPATGRAADSTRAGDRDSAAVATAPTPGATPSDVPAAVRTAAAGESPAPAPSDSVAHALAALGRESFAYGGQGRRDPFASLLKAGGDLRPLLTDLRLVTVLVGSDGRNSVAIMRDLATKEQYRRRAGESLGRMRVSRIDPRQVVFTIEEFGYSRQEVLTYGDSTTMRTR